jgi:NAD(P)-dependent dehydrogenase (short-subunit alcohol dehydrogenase family)
MQGKTVVVTGATSGIGLEAAEALARRGASLILVGRDPARGQAAVERVGAAGPKPRLFLADLSRQSEIRRLADEILDAAPRLDVLINNAGAMMTTRQVTEDGIERTFALNHMAYFLLTRLLLDRLEASAPARIVSVASGAHRSAGQLDFTDLQFEHDYSGWQAYARSKLANILFTRELARRLAGTGVTANCLHPGFVATRFGDNNGPGFRLMLGLAKRIGAISPAEGAKTIIYLASSAELAEASGLYFEKCRLAIPSPAAQDAAAASRLWTESERLLRL